SVDRSGFRAVQIKNHERRLKRPRLLENLHRGPGKRQLNAGLLCSGANLRAEKKVVDRRKNHFGMIPQSARTAEILCVTEGLGVGRGKGSAACSVRVLATAETMKVTTRPMMPITPPMSNKR